MIKIVIIGGRGNGTVIASTIEDCKRAGQDVSCAGFLNDEESEINGYPVLGKIQNDDWKRLPDDHFFIYALTSVKKAEERFQLLKELNIPVERFGNIIHPTAVVSETAIMGKGIVLMPYVVVGADVSIGNHSQMFAQSFIGHDSCLKEMVFVANNASVGGWITVGNGAHIGSNSCLLEHITIGEFAIVGLGSVVIKSVQSKEKAVGNPARIIGTI